MSRYREHAVTPMSSCVWPLTGVLLPLVPALWSPRRQTLYDWLSGTLVVEN